ncbi:unnamed protein product, partial [Heterotrigona itama]
TIHRLNIERNIITNHFFTSVSLAKKLLAIKTTVVEAIRSNKGKSLKLAKQKTFMLGYKTDILQYINVNRIKGSMHESITIEKNDLHIRKETIRFYNSTKFGIDMTDQMARKYILEMISANLFQYPRYSRNKCVYKETTEERISSQAFLLELAE